MNRFFIGVFAVFFSSSALAGPFGLEFGKPLSSLSGLKLKPADQKFVYITKTVPNSHPDFDEYRLLVTPSFGLCKYTGWISQIPTNGFGSGLRSKFDQLLEALSKKYGAPTDSFDFLRSGSIWREPREFMMALKKDERTLAAYWQNEKTALPDRIGSITLKAHAVSDNIGMISLVYSSTKESECIDEMRDLNNSSL